MGGGGGGQTRGRRSVLKVVRNAATASGQPASVPFLSSWCAQDREPKAAAMSRLVRLSDSRMGALEAGAALAALKTCAGLTFWQQACVQSLGPAVMDLGSSF